MFPPSLSLSFFSPSALDTILYISNINTPDIKTSNINSEKRVYWMRMVNYNCAYYKACVGCLLAVSWCTDNGNCLFHHYLIGAVRV